MFHIFIQPLFATFLSAKQLVSSLKMCEKTHMIICEQHLLFLSHLAKTGNVMTILVKLLSIKDEITLSKSYEMQTNMPSSWV